MAKEKTEKKPEISELVTLTKDGETIEAHPTQVQLWIDQGWTVQG